MIQIPENVRPHLEAVLKHHFWMLLGLVPIVVVPMVFVARGRLAAEIASNRSQVENRLSTIKSVEGVRPHPNDAWSSEIDKATRRVKRETLTEWQRLWTAQQPLRAWPASLGADFVQRVSALKTGGKLPRAMLERYQNGVRAVVRGLPARMGAEEFMVDAAAQGTVPPPGIVKPGMNRPGPAAGEKSAALVRWNPADQQRLYASFNWEKAPSTLQVLLAQEELWMYGVLADAVARVNKPSSGAYNAAIPVVEQFLVGYPAAEENPGAAGGARIVMPRTAGPSVPGGDFSPPPELPVMEGGAPGGAGGRPPHPRFGGGAGPMPGGGGEGPPPEGAVSPDETLRNWIYVDFAGKPLAAGEVAASPDAQFVHLVPFMIRAIIDERKLDALLVDLATAPVPIDVRQVRINAGPSGRNVEPMSPTGDAEGVRGMQRVAQTGPRPHDVTVEVRGTLALATPPDPQLLGLEAADEQEADTAASDAADDGAPKPNAEEPAADSVGGNQP